MHRRPPRSTRPATLFPYTTLCRSRYCARPSQRLAARRIAQRIRLLHLRGRAHFRAKPPRPRRREPARIEPFAQRLRGLAHRRDSLGPQEGALVPGIAIQPDLKRSEEHTSELQSLMRNSYAVFCLKNKKYIHHTTYNKSP